MIKNIHHKYSECVRSFCQSVPPILQVTTEEVDTYFHSCALYLWASGEQPGDIFGGINLLYTERQVKLTRQEFEDKINFYRSNLSETVGVPDFFLRMISSDRVSNTDNSRRFTEVQKKVLTMCTEYGGAFSILQGRRMTWLYEQLAAMCDQAEIGVDGSNLDSFEPERDHMKELSELVDDYRRDTSPAPENQEDGTSDDTLYPDPMMRTDGPTLGAVLDKGQDEDKLEEIDVEDELLSDPLEAAMNELNQLIGLETVKGEVTSLINLVRVNNDREKAGLPTGEKNLHLVFLGSPGTGKTTVARIIGKFYKALGVLKKGHSVEVERGDLIGEYIGQTAPKTKAVIDKAMDGVLFIDEAYSLVPEDNARDYGQEAIATILKAMEDHRDSLAVIVAGYEQEMDRFIKSNTGLQSRFKRQIHFEDYTPTQLNEILLRGLAKDKYFLDEPAKKLVLEYVQQLYDERNDRFGNAREMRNLLQELTSKQADRIVAFSDRSVEDLMRITVEDVEAVIEQHSAQTKKSSDEGNVSK